MEITPESSLKVLTSLAQRAPMSEAEAFGAQCAVHALEAAAKELHEFKNPPPPKAAD